MPTAKHCFCMPAFYNAFSQLVAAIMHFRGVEGREENAKVFQDNHNIATDLKKKQKILINS